MPSEIENEFTKANEPYFVEPSTSEKTDISNENYIGIEAIWNHKNYWVNLQTLNGGCGVCVNNNSIFHLLNK